MCGLFGWYLKPGIIPATNMAIVAAILASENETRGPDSFGLAITNGKDVKIDKAVGRVSARCNISKYVTAPILLGHTRRATSGKISHENAHPWLIKGIVGAHNGWVTNKAELDYKYKDRNCEVDSQHIFHQIGDKLDLSELKVHGAITYLMTRELDKIYLLRSQTGELAIHGLGKDRKKPLGIVWSSEESVVSQALDMAGIEHWPYEVKPKRMYTIENSMLYRLNGEVNFDPQYCTNTNVSHYKRNNSGNVKDYSDLNWHEGWVWNNEKRAYEPPLENSKKGNTNTVVVQEFRDGKLINETRKTNPINVIDVKRYISKKAADESLVEKVVSQITDNQTANQYMLDLKERVEDIVCGGCREIGPIVINHSFTGIRFYYEINQWLCNDCAKLWGRATEGKTN